MMSDRQVLLTAKGVSDALEKMADQIAASVPEGAGVGFIGIRNRGDVLAERLIALLQQRGVNEISNGVLDITLYRDDLAEIGGTAQIRATEIDFDITGLYLVLVDDVLYTGRTIRAALDALADIGRPQAIRLAVLVDRPGRELPVQADFAGVRVPEDVAHVNVSVRETDGVDEVQTR